MYSHSSLPIWLWAITTLLVALSAALGIRASAALTFPSAPPPSVQTTDGQLSLSAAASRLVVPGWGVMLSGIRGPSTFATVISSAISAGTRASATLDRGSGGISSAIKTASPEKVTPPTTTTSVPCAPAMPAPPPAPEATCGHGFHLLLYRYRIERIQNWVTNDVERKLYHEMKGCGAVTGWKWWDIYGAPPAVDFALPLWFKSGCPERAIRSAGGPANIKCS